VNDKNSNWRSIGKLHEPFNDAFNYRTRQQKEFFNKLFLRTEELDRCLAPATYFLMGEKGSGKTAYAVYLENNSLRGTKCQVTSMTETQYKRFIELKRQGKLAYSDYANIWRSILLFVAGRMIILKSKGFVETITRKFKDIEKLVEKWSENALNPEVESAFEAVSKQALTSSLGKEGIANVGGELSEQSTEKSPRIRHHLLETENELKKAISALSLPDNYILFIDGIDYRPESISYQEYIECVKGLGEAVWQLNTEFFGSIRDSKGRIKIMLLIRPDVFHALNLYNSNSRLQDNAVFLSWTATEKEFRSSKLYELSGKYFATQQSFVVPAQEAWEHYCESAISNSAVFRSLLKMTFQRPRDILTFIRIARAQAIKDGHSSLGALPADILHSPTFTREFADYLLGEIRNHAAFYMTQPDFANYMKFFQFLDGRSRFTMTEFTRAHERFGQWAAGEQIKATEYLRDPEAMLQYFYDVDVIGYSEQTTGGGETFFHWSNREKSLNNIAPKVKSSGTLLLNPGIGKALDIGKSLTTSTDSGKKHRQRYRKKGRRT
jgi:hypothetical protein